MSVTVGSSHVCAWVQIQYRQEPSPKGQVLVREEVNSF